MKIGICLGLVLTTVLAAGCGSSESTSEGDLSAQSTAAATAATTADTTSNAPSLVGRWERINECPQLVQALDQAGLRAIAPSVVGDYFPEESPKDLARKDEVCEGAEPFVHSHFFDEAGAFGSLDENGQQVDDGSYEIIGEGRFRIGNPDTGAVFRYEIDGDALSLSPVLTQAMKKNALAQPLQFSPAGWAVAVSYPGHEWKRVSCDGWC